MLKNHLLAALLATVIAVPAFAETPKPAASAPAAAPVAPGAVATVNGKPISAESLDQFVKQFTREGREDTPELRAMILNELIAREILLQEAQKQKLTDSPEIRNEIDNARQMILMRSVVRAYALANPVTDAEIQAEYDKQKAAVSGDEYHARHILVGTEKEALAIIAKLKKGAKFEALAKGTMDVGSAANGGDLGWSQASAYVPEFGNALKALKKGQLTDKPVKTQYGFHVIRLEEVRPAQPQPLEAMKNQIAQALQQAKIQAYQKQLRDAAVIKQ